MKKTGSQGREVEVSWHSGAIAAAKFVAIFGPGPTIVTMFEPVWHHSSSTRVTEKHGARHKPGEAPSSPPPPAGLRQARACPALPAPARMAPHRDHPASDPHRRRLTDTLNQPPLSPTMPAVRRGIPIHWRPGVHRLAPRRARRLRLPPRRRGMPGAAGAAPQPGWLAALTLPPPPRHDHPLLRAKGGREVPGGSRPRPPEQWHGTLLAHICSARPSSPPGPPS